MYEISELIGPLVFWVSLYLIHAGFCSNREQLESLPQKRSVAFHYEMIRSCSFIVVYLACFLGYIHQKGILLKNIGSIEFQAVGFGFVALSALHLVLYRETK